jgi:hypothetical protein
MATVEKIITNRKKDRLTALLALTASRRATASSCLTVEALAAFMDGQCSTQERQLTEAHLADCEECYAQWCAVVTVMAAGKSGRKKIAYLFRWRNLRYFGSALAIAASVVIFVHLKDTTMKESVYRVPASLEMQQDREALAKAKKLPVDKEQQMNEAPAPVANPVQKAERPPRQAQELNATGGTIVPRKNKIPNAVPRPVAEEAKDTRRESDAGESSPVPQTTAPAGTINMTDAAVSSAGRQTAIAAPVEQWLQQVQTGCRQGRFELDFWLQMQSAGQKIRRGQTVIDNETDRQKLFSRILIAIEAMKRREDISRQCEVVRTLLAEEPGSR